jgi:pimeloyl-ACP methyl ester carboxylesterase
LSAHIASQSEERFVERGYAVLVRATERQAARGDVAAQAFLPALRQASPAALHRSATSLRETRVPSYQRQLANLTMPKAMITGEHSPPFEPPAIEVNLRGYVVRDAGHVMMADNPDEFTSAVTRALDR